MSKEVYRIEIPIETVDKYSDGLKKAEKDVKDFEKTAKGASKGFESIGGSARKSEGDVTKFQGSVRGSVKMLKDFTSKRWNLSIHAVDRASRVVSGINSFVQRLAGRSYRFTIRALDLASRTVRGIFRAITSIPAMITIALSVVGLGKLKDATVGAAMSFEGYETSMTHWLDGNTTKAKELVGWMGKFADSTPFSSVDLFPALAKGVGIAGGDVSEAQRMLKISADMAALTPGRSVEDAMDALEGAQMGNFTMMKGFGMRVLKEDYDNMGGWAGFLDQAANRFEDGAVKLSKTSTGILATLAGYRSSIFRSLGEGILEPMKPRLDSINKWLENNQDTWGRWKDTVKGAGIQASEWAFSKLENGFSHIKSNYLENDEFKSLSFEGKIAFVMDDINGWWQSQGKPALTSWWDSTGQPFIADMGLMIGKGLATGIKTGVVEGLSTLGDMWSNVGEDAKEHGVFSKETASSAGGAAAVTLAAGAGASMLLAPLFKGVGGLFKGGKAAGKFFKKGNVPPKQSDGKTSTTTTKKTDTKSTKKSDGNTNTKKVNRAPTTPGSAPRPDIPKFLNPKNWTLPKGMTKLLKGVPFLNTMVTGATLMNTTKETVAGDVGMLAGGFAGMKAGALGGSLLGPWGTLVGGAAGGVAGAFGGEKLMNWIFGPKKESATDKTEQLSSEVLGTSSLMDSSGDSTAMNESSQVVAAAMSALAEKTQVTTHNIEALNMVLGESAGWVVGAFQPLAESTAVIQHNISALSLNLGEASVWVVEGLYPLAEQGPLITQNMTALATNLGEASIWIVEGLYPLAEQGALVGQNISALSTNLGEASIWVVEGLYPLAEQGPLVTQNMSALALNLGEASIWVVEGLYPIMEQGSVVSGNLNILSGWTAQASGWVASLSVIQEGAIAVNSALSNLALRISSVPTPSVSVDSRPIQGPKPYANGGYINSPHLGLVGEAGPEMIIPLSSGRKGRAMELYQQTGQMLGVKPYANGGLAGQSPSSGRGNNVIDFFERTGIQPQVYNDNLNVEPLVSTSTNAGASGTSSGVVVHQQIDVKPDISIVVEASSDGSIDVSGISDSIVDEIGVKLASKIMEAKGNMFITAR